MESTQDLFLLLPSFAFIFLSLFIIYFIRKVLKNTENKDGSQDAMMLQNQMQEIIKSNNDLKISNEVMKSELSEKLNEKISEGHKQMGDSVNLQFQESQKLIKEITGELNQVKKTGEQVVGFTDQLKNLQDILQNSKQRGALGEYFLESTIQNILPPDNYEFQYSFSDGSIVDAVIKLPDGMVSVDSKFSLENYNRIIAESNPETKKVLEKVFREDLKKRIMETAKYIKPKEGTMDFAFMFIPSEGIYYDLLISKIGMIDSKNFLEYAFRDKKVIVVSPSTLYAYLQTVMQGMRSLKIEKQAGQIMKKVEDLHKHLKSYKTYHDKLGNSISTVTNQYNQTNKEFGKIDKDVLKITASTDDKLSFDEVNRPKIED